MHRNCDHWIVVCSYFCNKIHILLTHFLIVPLSKQIAAAALYVSLCLVHYLVHSDKPVTYDSLWNPVLEFYSTYSANHLRPIVKELIAYILTAPTSKTNNVYTKYTSTKQGEMALVCERTKHILNDILEQEWCVHRHTRHEIHTHTPLIVSYNHENYPILVFVCEFLSFNFILINIHWFYYLEI